MRDELGNIRLFATQPHPCSYLENRDAVTVFVDPAAIITSDMYSELSQIGFRRSGVHFYRPHCKGCEECIPVRIPVDLFQPNRQQKRIARNNAGLQLETCEQLDPASHYSLYERYINERHQDGDMYPPTIEQFTNFLCTPWEGARYLLVKDAGRLVAVAAYDVLDHGLSAVYTFFDPDAAKNSLGTFCILQEIELARQAKLPYLYLGYWIRDCEKMRYKSAFRPLELYLKKHWRRLC